jgi:uncharacterized delta-60 repeat protein
MMPSLRLPHLVLPALLACAMATDSHAQVLDTSFGVNGLLPYGGPLSNSQNNKGVGHNSVVQPDGKIVVAADKWDPNTSDLFYYTYRYNPDGSPDSTFGNNGVSRLFVGDKCKSFDLLLESDGRIVVIGQSEYCINGICGAPQFIMMRLLPNGDLDTSFGNEGHLISSDVFGNQGTFAIPSRVRRYADGSYFIGGRGVGARPFVARLQANGYPLASFATNGIHTDTTHQSSFRDLALDGQQRGYVLMRTANYVGGIIDSTNQGDNLLLRLTPTGALDPTFGTNGSLRLDLMNNDNPVAITFLPDGRLLLLGSHWMATLSTSGSLLSGPHYIGVAGFDGIALDKALPLANDRIMLSGKVHHYINGNWQEQAYLAQVDDQGQYRTDFNGTGYLVMDHGSIGTTGWQGKLCRLFDVDVAPDGSVVATGYRNPNPGATLRSVHVVRVLDVPGTASNVSVAEARPLPTLAVFPNPTQGLLQVDAPTTGPYALYNALGGLVQQGWLMAGRNTLQLGDDRPSGVYLLQVEDGTGLGAQVIRVMKE